MFTFSPDEPGMRGMNMREAVHFDVRTKLFLLLMTNILLFAGSGIPYEAVIVGFCGLILALSGKLNTALKFVLLFAVMSAVDILVAGISGGFWISLLRFLVVILRRFLPVFMASSLVLATKVSEFVACMWKLRLPKYLIISVSVVFRFFPALRREWQAILSSMQMRGIGVSLRNLVAHPLLTAEYLLVPLLLHAVKISDEVSEAALCRGLDCDDQHTSLTVIKMRIGDLVVCLVPLIGLIIQKTIK